MAVGGGCAGTSDADQYRCAMCGYDGRLGGEAVGLETAHLCWWSYDGPDQVANGLCLCSFRHKLLDRGVLGLTEEHTVRVSQEFVGHSAIVRQLVIDLTGRPLPEPQQGLPIPDTEHVGWHTDQVFRSPSRLTPE